MICKYAGEPESAWTWLVANALGGAHAARLAKQMSAHGKGPVPWGGVAAPLRAPTSAASGQLQGRVFCFLPLPLHSGLPVHVNGLFEVTNNRQACMHPQTSSTP